MFDNLFWVIHCLGQLSIILIVHVKMIISSSNGLQLGWTIFKNNFVIKIFNWSALFGKYISNTFWLEWTYIKKCNWFYFQICFKNSLAIYHEFANYGGFVSIFWYSKATPLVVLLEQGIQQKNKNTICLNLKTFIEVKAQ